jgi:ABC-2 type transport system permease protein
VLRDPRLRVLLVVPPVIQLIVFGFAVNLDVENTALVWMDQDRTPASRALRESFAASRYFTLRGEAASEDEVSQALDRGEAMAVVRVLPGFGRDLARGSTAQVQVLIDGTNSNTASIVSRYASGVISSYSSRVAAEMRRRPPPPALSLETRVWFNAELRSRNYFVPGVLVNIVAIITGMLTAMSIVREKEIGTMEQLLVTPIRPIELMLGKTLPFATFGMLQVVLLTAASLLVFEVPFRGSFLTLGGCAALFLLTTLGAGLFISTISRTQQQAMMTFFFIFIPLFLLSGFAFPISSMPVFFQYLTYLDPLRYFIEIVRGIFLKGVGVEVLWPQIVAMGVYGTAILTASALRFHRKLD